MSLPNANAVVSLGYGAVERHGGFIIMQGQLAPIGIREIMFNILNILR
jgi:hypothetical protein